MIKQKKTTILITSLITLLPILAGLLLWKLLPDTIPTHWNIHGEVDGYSSKAFAVFLIPLFLLAVHLVCIFASHFDKKNSVQNGKIINIILWICPCVSLLCGAMFYLGALGIAIPADKIIMPLLGITFIIIGNYMPKIKQNYTIGIKIPWTLKDEANWNATHRFCGKVWVLGGLAFILCTFLHGIAIAIAFAVLIPLLVILPMIYSYVFYKNSKQK